MPASRILQSRKQHKPRENSPRSHFVVCNNSAKCYDPGMADSAAMPTHDAIVPAATSVPRHSALVRITHWITTLSFLALLVSGMDLVISHPRFYWGEAGNIWTKPLFR